ncbi:hypothetical protein DRE_07197 [Drechslerella stenobrocha 248]|uniref:Uncharacterized protein n=1 Tax=Drechslerella stenobrocha 248 TaxID=1043628 RepID=W7I5X7_9PEZI|nr:hypothetical protein DRE_07197 [Drechslerella stenobrocha 248]
MDPETASIRSNAPSYVSQAPSYHARPPSISDLPPYSPDRSRLPPPYSRQHASLSTVTPPRRPSGSSRPSHAQAPSPSRPNFTPSPISGIPPIAFITPGTSKSQSRHYEAVAARRNAEIVSLVNQFSSLLPPEQPRRRNKRNRPGIPFADFSSLPPAPSTTRARLHSTAELFLCTCGRPNHGKIGDESPDPPPFGRQLSQSSGPVERHADEPIHREESVRVENSAVGCAGPPAASEVQETGKETTSEAKEDQEEDLLDAEGKSWDFMLSQMA